MPSSPLRSVSLTIFMDRSAAVKLVTMNISMQASIALSAYGLMVGVISPEYRHEL